MNKHDEDENETITFTVDPDLAPDGHWLMGELSVPYWKMVNLFGEPQPIKAEKSRIQWVVAFSDGGSAVIYDWKETGPIEDVRNWNIGATERKMAWRVQDIVDGRPIEY